MRHVQSTEKLKAKISIFNRVNHCDVPVSTPHSSGFARLEFEAFYFVARFPTFYGIINFQSRNESINLLAQNIQSIQMFFWHEY
jgi:hypothetical protein